MKWQNNVQLIGYLGKDPFFKILSPDRYYAVLRVATNNGFTKPNKQRITMWHTVKIWGKRPAYLQNCLMKGSHVLVDGKVVYKTFEDKSGILRNVTEIEAKHIMNLDR